MEDLEAAPGSPVGEQREEPQGNDDPRDPLNPNVEEEDRPPAPLADPTADVDTFEDDEAPETVQAMDDAVDEDETGAVASALDDEDPESELEELDEEQFNDIDLSALNIPDQPVQVDESNVGLLGVHKRKRTEEEERERKKKRKEGRREKPKRAKKRIDGDEEDNFEGGDEIDGKRARKGGDGRPSKSVRAATPEDEEHLTPEERQYLHSHLSSSTQG